MSDDDKIELHSTITEIIFKFLETVECYSNKSYDRMMNEIYTEIMRDAQ